eukprot:9358755-Pyramimonas_sp.AAC.2
MGLRSCIDDMIPMPQNPGNDPIRTDELVSIPVSIGVSISICSRRARFYHPPIRLTQNGDHDELCGEARLWPSQVQLRDPWPSRGRERGSPRICAALIEPDAHARAVRPSQHCPGGLRAACVHHEAAECAA